MYMRVQLAVMKQLWNLSLELEYDGLYNIHLSNTNAEYGGEIVPFPLWAAAMSLWMLFPSP